MTSLSFVPVDGSGHVATPEAGTFKKADGSPADLMYAQSYPVTADCKACGRPCRLEHKLQLEWRHVP